jgi:hypothetical protein
MGDDLHLTMTELEAGLDNIQRAPRDAGVVELIVRRPQAEARQAQESARLDTVEGLVGDNWRWRHSARSADGWPNPDTQLTLMNARVAALVARQKERWPLAGDQLFVDMDLSAANLPPGTRLSIGSAEIEITGEPHTGCKKFAARFGAEALRFISSAMGRSLNMRGVYAKVVRPGTVTVGDVARKS